MNQFEEHEGGWTWKLVDGRIARIQIDFCLELHLEDGQTEVRVRIETQCNLKIAGAVQSLLPESAKTLAPILPFFNRKVLSIEIAKSGKLCIEMEDDSSLEVEPDDAYEAWQIFGDNIQIICVPGGNIATLDG